MCPHITGNGGPRKTRFHMRVNLVSLFLGQRGVTSPKRPFDVAVDTAPLLVEFKTFYKL